MTDIIDYNSDLEYLLKIHAEECESFSILHRYSFEKYSERSNYLNIPVILGAVGIPIGLEIPLYIIKDKIINKIGVKNFPILSITLLDFKENNKLILK